MFYVIHKTICHNEILISIKYDQIIQMPIQYSQYNICELKRNEHKPYKN